MRDDDLSPPALAVLRVLADADDGARSVPLSLNAIARAAGLSDNAKARYALLLLSDRRLIDGYGTARRLTDAGWETLDAAGGGL